MSFVHLIAAARPNFMKVAPLWHELSRRDWCNPVLVHTGQHYDAAMSDVFFRDLRLPEPHHHLGVGSGSHAEQTAAVMTAYERLCVEQPPDWVIVVGDVNSTLACTLAAKKLCLNVAHLEAGLRSGDRTMPEEINRIVTDSISDLLWTPSPDADANLEREGVAADRIVRVGNIMIDSFEMLRDRIVAESAHTRWDVEPGRYGVVTLHRPANVDHPQTLAAIVSALTTHAGLLPLILPLHPRTRARLTEFDLLQRLEASPGIHIVPPQPYVAFMSLVLGARLVLTDSGGIQEETSYLGIPCLTLRPNTERPITVEMGTNRLVTLDDLDSALSDVLNAGKPKPRGIPMWDGRTAIRVADSLESARSA